MDNVRRSSSILWMQVWGLAAVQAAITTAWVIYNVYIPDLLKQFGFPTQFAITLLIVENALAVFMEPLMGGLSDQSHRWLTTKYPFITFGIVASSVFFIAIPSVVIFGSSNLLVQWLLPAVIIIWSLAMTTFRSPAMALLGMYASRTNLPVAISILSIAGGLAGALRPLASQFILSLGAGVAFTIGSVVLLGAAGILRFTTQSASDLPIPTSEADVQKRQILILILSILLIVGLGMGWGLRLTLGEVVPRVLKAEVAFLSLGLLLGLVSIGLGAVAILGGKIATKFGNRPVMLVSLLLTMGCVGLLTLVHGAIATGILVTVLVCCLGIALNGTIPLALELMPADQGGLGIGMYFGGFAAAISLFSVVFPKPAEMMNLGNAAGLGVIAFTIASLGILASCFLSQTKIKLAAE